LNWRRRNLIANASWGGGREKAKTTQRFGASPQQLLLLEVVTSEGLATGSRGRRAGRGEVLIAATLGSAMATTAIGFVREEPRAY